MDTTKSVGNASTSTKAMGWQSLFGRIWTAILKHPVIAAVIFFVLLAVAQTILQILYSTDYRCLQLTDANVSVVYPHWLARDGSQQQAPVVLQLASTCAEKSPSPAVTNTPVSTGSSQQSIATPIALMTATSQQPASPLAQRMLTQTPIQTAPVQSTPAQPVSLVVDSGLDVAVVQGLDLAQSSPFTVTLDASNPEQTLIVSYLPVLPSAGDQRSVTINGQELPIELEEPWKQWWRLVSSALFGPAGVALAAIGFLLVALQEDRRQRELREIAELEKIAEKCANNSLPTSEFLSALERLSSLKNDNVGSIVQTFADYSVTALRADPWYVFEHSTRWEQGLQHLSSLVNNVNSG